MKRTSALLIISVASLSVVLLCCCLGATSIAGVSLYLGLAQQETSDLVFTPLPTETSQPTPKAQAPLPALPMATPVTPEILPSPTHPVSTAITETLELLEEAIVPVNDPIELARRLEGKENLPRSLQFPTATFREGDSKTFWVTDSDTNENFQVRATLRYVTEHVYFWVEDGVSYNSRHLKALVDTFEEKIYPTNRAFFGSEWTPGVDADPHLFILYARGLGGNVAGYFSSNDEYLPQVRQYSNGHEMFLLSADHISLDEEYAYSVLAHEFQHMIHWYRDRNEETWINEGASDLAAFLNGYSIGSHDALFARNPDIQLNDWPTNPRERTAHYGSSFLFMTYFLDRFGEKATQTLVSDPANGFVSIDNVLYTLGLRDPLTGGLFSADSFFTDWLITNYLQDKRVADGRYTYHNYPAAPDFRPTEKITSCPTDEHSRQVNQYGVNYIQITCQGSYILHFEGQTQVGVLPSDPFSGEYAFYSNRGDESNMTLTRTFDFTGHSAPLTLRYWTWFDLEQDYDYVFLSASLDGESWQILTTPSGTPEDPSGNSYGWGYNGASGAGPVWIQEEVDLSQFAGKVVQLRFEYITDAAVNGEGFLLDDVSIPEIGYFTDFERDADGWQASGFVRIRNLLPQKFTLALITKGRETKVQKFDLSGHNTIDIPLQFENGLREVILVVSGNTRFTRQKASYTFSIIPR